MQITTCFGQVPQIYSGDSGRRVVYGTKSQFSLFLKCTSIRLFQTSFHSGFSIQNSHWVQKFLSLLESKKLNYLLHLASVGNSHVCQLDTWDLVKRILKRTPYSKQKKLPHPLFFMIGISAPELQPPSDNLPTSFGGIRIHITLKFMYFTWFVDNITIH